MGAVEARARLYSRIWGVAPRQPICGRHAQRSVRLARTWGGKQNSQRLCAHHVNVDVVPVHAPHVLVSAESEQRLRGACREACRL